MNINFYEIVITHIRNNFYYFNKATSVKIVVMSILFDIYDERGVVIMGDGEEVEEVLRHLVNLGIAEFHNSLHQKFWVIYRGAFEEVFKQDK